ncbi:uncharacterized protein ACRADG_000803 [Cochliomyia hominivorax]
MSSHMGRAYLNTCLKVPIDPCNNCPAPVYSRPNMYLGRLSATTSKTKHSAGTSQPCSTAETRPKWSCGGIKSLAKLYDSIPDYRDLNHLSGEEFYHTLDTLRSTCQNLKAKTSCLSSEDRCSTTTTTSSLNSSNNNKMEGSRCKKSKKSKKKKKSNIHKDNGNCFEGKECDFIQNLLHPHKLETCNEIFESKEHCNSISRKSCKKDIEEEVDNFKKSLQEFENEFKRPFSACPRTETRSSTRGSPKDFLLKTEDNKKKETTKEKVPVRSTFTSTLRERLRKSLSFNDIHTITEPLELIELRKKNKTLEHLSFKGDNSTFQDPSRLSNYFSNNTNTETTEIPKIVVESPSTDQTNERLQGKKKNKQKFSTNEEYSMAFKVFDLDSNKKQGSTKHSTPSPVHPVARPNLAATLRVESSKKKVKELKNNCTYHDTTPQFDWEVRKTPAWKTLSLNESHKEILQLRLATRKAEQALQQREYELNMELMRQRVKSAPLLLEGPTYWGPHVGKLTHACQKEGRRHMCQSNQQRIRRKKNSSRNHCCRRNLMLNSSMTLEGEYLNNSTNIFKVQSDSCSNLSQKLNNLRKIYGNAGNANRTKSYSRNSNHSTNTSQSSKNHKKKYSKGLHTQEEKSCQESCKVEPNLEKVELDSGDELSSLDRAFL